MITNSCYSTWDPTFFRYSLRLIGLESTDFINLIFKACRTTLQISTTKLLQKCCGLDFSTTNLSIVQIVVYLRGYFCISKCPSPAVVCSWGSRIRFPALSMINHSKFCNVCICCNSVKIITICSIQQSVVKIASVSPLRETYDAGVVDFTTDIFAVHIFAAL